MKFGHLILRKIIKFVGTRCWILRLKGTKFNFGWGSAPDPARGAYSAPQAHPPGSGGLRVSRPPEFSRGRPGPCITRYFSEILWWECIQYTQQLPFEAHCKWGIYVKWSKLAFYFKISDRVLGILPCQILSELRQIFTIFILQHYAKRYIIAWMQTWTRFPQKTPIYPPFLLITHFYPRIAFCRL